MNNENDSGMGNGADMGLGNTANSQVIGMATAGANSQVNAIRSRRGSFKQALEDITAKFETKYL